MVRWQDALQLAAYNVEEHFDVLRDRLIGRLSARHAVQIIPYRGYGTAEKLLVRGRVLRDNGVRSARDNDDTWDNLLNMYRRAESWEVRRARVRLCYGGVAQEVIADEEGMFRTWLDISTARGEHRAPADEAETLGNLWCPVEIELLTPQIRAVDPVRATCFVLVPPPTARFAVISDIDDTVIRTDVGHFMKMARTLFLGNARLRLPFEGVGAFYRALYAGATGHEQNPLFYVSNSPWNLYDLFTDFFQIQDIPVGPVLNLRNWGPSPRGLRFRAVPCPHIQDESHPRDPRGLPWPPLHSRRRQRREGP